MTCDIFCRVIDNFGDVGVTWRLARQLGNEFEITTRLFVDDLVSLAVLVPALDPLQSSQIVEGVEVRGWPGDHLASTSTSTLTPANCVIEAFQCALPPQYVNAMTLRRVAPVWLNFDYLSAESWVVAHHLLPSPHPQLALNKYFFFPGFERGTGGLLRERDLFLRRDAAQLTVSRQHANELRVLIFGYANAALPELLNAIECTNAKAVVTIPHGKLCKDATVWQNDKSLRSSDSPSINIQPFVPQSEFDGLLWSQDVCFIRGEDSFVRTQWAAKPFVWQIYPTSDGAHLTKLNAFLDRYCADLNITAAAAVRELWRTWNSEDAVAIAPAWREFMRHCTVLNLHARAWADQLAAQPDLATNLVTFVQKSAKIEGLCIKLKRKTVNN